MTSPSKSQVRAAASRLRKHFLSGEELDAAQMARDRDTISAHRKSFKDPMLGVRMGLKSFVKTTGMREATLAQRLKRLPRILGKLARYPTMQILSMDDIAGCRVRVESLDEQRKLVDHILMRWDKKGQVVRVRDYVAQPKDSGYRAVHVVALRDGRRVEIQVRTRLQDEWANAVEDSSRALGEELKWGRGPEAAFKYYRVWSETLEDVEKGLPLSRARVQELKNLRRIASATVPKY